jgi:hypothetical protein
LSVRGTPFAFFAHVLRRQKKMNRPCSLSANRAFLFWMVRTGVALAFISALHSQQIRDAPPPAVRTITTDATVDVGPDIELPSPDGKIVIPSSSIVRPDDALIGRAHTNIVLYLHVNNTEPGPTFETPASLACVYHLVPQVSGCPIAHTTAVPTGGAGAIALVEAYAYPTAANDLDVFSKQFGLPPADLTVVYATGTPPPPDPFNGDWDLEQALDMEWAHAMAPQAKIYLVQAASQNLSDLLQAELVASNLVIAAGGGEISNSWGYPESSSSTAIVDDGYFGAPGVAYFASTGDSAFSLNYPAVSPNVVAAGGTSLQRDAAGNFIGESYWDNIYGGGGGGLSTSESRPSYQNIIANIVGTHRGVPDLSTDADPLSGVAVYDSTPYSYGQVGWVQLGGTSVSSPTLAGIANLAAAADSTGVLAQIYGNYASPLKYVAEYHDITKGNSNCKVGWDICSGVGSPLAYTALAGPDFSLTLRPNWISKVLVNGFTLTVKAAGHFSGTVELSCTLPGEVCSMNPSSITGSGTILMLTGPRLASEWDGLSVTGISGNLKHTVQYTYVPPFPQPPCKPGLCQ